MSSKQQSRDSDNPFADDDEEDAASSERSVRVAMDRETIVLVAALTDGLGLQKTTIDLVSEKLKKTLTYRELVVDLQVHHQVPKGASIVACKPGGAGSKLEGGPTESRVVRRCKTDRFRIVQDDRTTSQERRHGSEAGWLRLAGATVSLEVASGG